MAFQLLLKLFVFDCLCQPIAMLFSVLGGVTSII